MKTNRPYIGVTAFMTRYQVEKALSYMPPNSNRKLMVGVLASSTTLEGLSNKLPGRFPVNGEIENIFVEHPLAFNVVHYATRNPETLFTQLCDVVELAPRGLIHAIQLNIVWPDPDVLAKFKDQFPDIALVLQVGPKALDAVERNKDVLSLKLKKEYEHKIDYVLLDDSGGYGKEMDPQFLLWIIRKLKAKKFDANIVVAGGLSPFNLELVTAIAKELPEVSIDAEGKLRHSKIDCLDMKLVEQYLTSAPGYITF